MFLTGRMRSLGRLIVTVSICWSLKTFFTQVIFLKSTLCIMLITADKKKVWSMWESSHTLLVKLYRNGSQIGVPCSDLWRGSRHFQGNGALTQLLRRETDSGNINNHYPFHFPVWFHFKSAFINILHKQWSCTSLIWKVLLMVTKTDSRFQRLFVSCFDFYAPQPALSLTLRQNALIDLLNPPSTKQHTKFATSWWP